MEFIEKILLQSTMTKKSDWFSSLLALIFFFVVNFAIIVFFNGSKILVLMFLVGAVISPIIGLILGTKLSKILFKKNKRIRFKNWKTSSSRYRTNANVCKLL